MSKFCPNYWAVAEEDDDVLLSHCAMFCSARLLVNASGTPYMQSSLLLPLSIRALSCGSLWYFLNLWCFHLTSNPLLFRVSRNASTNVWLLGQGTLCILHCLVRFFGPQSFLKRCHFVSCTAWVGFFWPQSFLEGVFWNLPLLGSFFWPQSFLKGAILYPTLFGFLAAVLSKSCHFVIYTVWFGFFGHSHV